MRRPARVAEIWWGVAEMKKLHPWPPAAAMTTTVSLVYVVCAALFALFPRTALNFFGSWFHGIDLVKIASETTITLSSFLVGLVGIAIFTMVFTTVFVLVYNSCIIHCERMGWIKESKNG
jgi:hypothetical protein